jgi:hypothetical protein
MFNPEVQKEESFPTRTGGWEGSLRGGRGTTGETPVATNPPALPSNSPPPANLFLIGTVPGDPRGYGRAWKLLHQLQPDLITVEISRFSVRYRLGQEKRWQRLLRLALKDLPASEREHPAIQRLTAQVALPFEFRVARDYSRTCGIPWRPLDLGAPARRHLPRYAGELLSTDNLRALLATGGVSMEEFVAGEFRRARLAYERSPWRLTTQSAPETLRRERVLANRLRRLSQKGRRVLHLGGWEHLVPWRDLSGLRGLLADLQPQTLLLGNDDPLSVDKN